MQNNTWFYCCRVLTVVLEPAQDTVIKHTHCTLVGSKVTYIFAQFFFSVVKPINSYPKIHNPAVSYLYALETFM